MYTFDPSAHKICLLQIVPQAVESKACMAMAGRRGPSGSDWPRLAVDRGSLGHELALRGASGAARRPCHVVCDAGAADLRCRVGAVHQHLSLIHI